MKLLPSSLHLIEALTPSFFLHNAAQSRTRPKAQAYRVFSTVSSSSQQPPSAHVRGLWAASAHDHLSGLSGASPQLGRILA